MPFSTINLGSTDTRLLKHADTVYKVKFSGRDDFFLAEVCTQDQANKELEEVLRGVIYLDQRDGPLKPIYTEHFQVHVKRRSWKIADKICFKQNGRSLKNYHYFYEFAVAARAEEENDQEYLSDEAEKVDADADKEGAGDSNGDEKDGKNSNVDEESEENSNDITCIVEDEINDAGSESRQSWSETLDESSDDWTPSDSSDVDWWRVSKGYKGKKKKSRQKSSKTRTLQKNKAEDSSDGEESMIQNLQKKKKRKTKVLQISESESESKESSTPDDTIKLRERKAKESVAKNTKKQKQKKSLDSNRNVDNILGTSYRETRQKRIAEDSMNSSLLGGRRSRRLYNPSDGPMTELPSILEPDICSITVDDNDRSSRGDRSRSRSRRDEEESNVSKIKPKYTSLDKLTEMTSTRRESLRERKGVATVTSPTESKSKNSEKTEVHSNRKESLGRKSARASVTSPKYSGQDNTNIPSNRRGSLRERREEISYTLSTGPKSESPKDDERTGDKSESPKDDKMDDKRRSILGRKVDKDKTGGDKETVSSEEESAESHESKTKTRKQKLHDSNGTISPSGGTKSSTGRKKSPDRGSDLEQLSYSEGRRIRYSLRSPVKRLQKDARQLRSQSSSPVKRAVGDRSSLRSRSNSATNQLGRKSYLADESGRLQRMRLSAEKDNSRKVALTPKDRHVVEKEELEEVLKLQELAKSEPTHKEQRKIAKKRNSTGMWDMIDSVMNPVVKLFRGSRNSDT